MPNSRITEHSWLNQPKAYHKGCWEGSVTCTFIPKGMEGRHGWCPFAFSRSGCIWMSVANQKNSAKHGDYKGQKRVGISCILTRFTIQAELQEIIPSKASSPNAKYIWWLCFSQIWEVGWGGGRGESKIAKKFSRREETLSSLFCIFSTWNSAPHTVGAS